MAEHNYGGYHLSWCVPPSTAGQTSRIKNVRHFHRAAFSFVCSLSLLPPHGLMRASLPRTVPPRRLPPHYMPPASPLPPIRLCPHATFPPYSMFRAFLPTHAHLLTWLQAGGGASRWGIMGRGELQNLSYRLAGANCYWAKVRCRRHLSKAAWYFQPRAWANAVLAHLPLGLCRVSVVLRDCLVDIAIRSG